MYKVYCVQIGDNIANIAEKSGINPQELINLNGLEGEVNVGELIVVPNNIFQNYTVQKGDTIYDIAKRYNVNYEYLLKMNGLNKDDYIYPNQQLLIPQSDMSIYITKEDDSLNNVANNLNVSKDELIKQNETIYLMPDQLIIYRK